MITAIVLLHVDVHAIPETAQAIANIARVSEVYSVTGEWELVALVRVSTHEEIADVVVFLASERASFVNGGLLTIDGAQRKGIMDT